MERKAGFQGIAQPSGCAARTRIPVEFGYAPHHKPFSGRDSPGKTVAATAPEGALEPMSLSPENIKQVAHLARLELRPEQVEPYAAQLSNILALVDQLSGAATAGVEPMAHPLDMHQRLRPDAVTEADQREAFQAIAPEVDSGLYLVPKVIE